jgi:hypothetical protein
VLCGHSQGCALPPGPDSLPHVLTVCGGCAPAAPRAERRRHRSVGGEDALGLPRGLAPWPAPFPWPGRWARVVRAIVQVSASAVCRTGQRLSLRRLIAPQLVGYHRPRDIPPALAQLPAADLGGRLVTPTLHENIQRRAILIHGSPEGVAIARNRAKPRLQMPLLPRARLPVPSLGGLDRSTLATPTAHGLVGQHDSTFGHQRFDVALARAEANIEPDTMANNLGRDPRAFIQVGWWWVHAASMSPGAGAVQARSSFDNALLALH